jgi:hypothetical protein
MMQPLLATLKKSTPCALSLAALAALALSAAAIAANDNMANYYGNIVIGKSAVGQSHIHYKANHTFDAALSSDQGSMQTDGTWAFNDKLCRTYTPVPGLPNTLCAVRTSELTLVAGIQ